MKDLIKNKAQELFSQYGMRSVSMDDIATAVGSSKKTLYQYYEDKEALVLEVVEEIIQQNHHCTEKDKTDADNAIHEAFLALDGLAKLFNRMNPAVLFDLHKYHPKVYERFTSYKNVYLHETIKKNIERGISEGLYRHDIDIEIVSHFRVQSTFVPFHPEFYTKVNKSLFDTQKEIFILFLYGLATPEGYKMINIYKTQIK